MSNLFKRALIFTGINFGLKSNSQVHNKDYSAFIKRATIETRKENCDTALFLANHKHWQEL